MSTRRSLFRGAASGIALAKVVPLLPRNIQAKREFGPSTLPAGTLDASIQDALPCKRPLIKKSFRPPNYETQVSVFNEAITPNDAFFVRYHLANIPEVDARTWRLKGGGDTAERSVVLGLADLKTQFPATELTAVCQCSGNRRGLSNPQVPGGQWGLGAMGKAVWKGARPKDVLAKEGIKKEAVEIVFDGANTAVAEKTCPRSLRFWRATTANRSL